MCFSSIEMLLKYIYSIQLSSFLSYRFYRIILFEFRMVPLWFQGVNLLDSCMAKYGFKGQEFTDLSDLAQGQVLGCMEEKHVSVLIFIYFKMGFT